MPHPQSHRARNDKHRRCHCECIRSNHSMLRQYYVYILTNFTNTVLYTGVTNDLIRRIYEHKNKTTHGFTAKYNVNKLLFYEATDNIESAILREKQIKAGSRQKKIDLINKQNPEWKDLYAELI